MHEGQIRSDLILEMHKYSVPAVIVGFEANGLGVARALRREGIESVSLVGPSWSPSCASWTSKTVMASAWTEEAVVSDLLAIGQRFTAKAPLLVTKDEPVLWISANRVVLGEFFEIVMPEPDTVLLLMDKTRFQALATARGWPLPRTWLAKDLAELKELVADITYPCILKPAIKNSEFRRESPRKAFKIFHVQQLFDTYDLVSKWESEVIVQEWIGGGDDRVVFSLGYWDSNSQNLALFPGRKLRQWPPECGNTALSEPAPMAWRRDLGRITAEIYNAVGYRGLGSIEYKMSPDGRVVVMEPTVGRTNYQNEVAVLNGVNLPAIAYFDAMGMTSELSRLVDRAKQEHRSTKLIDIAADYRSARFYMAESKLDWRGWLRSRRGRKYDMLYRSYDPAPALLSVSRELASFAKHRILKPILGRLVGRS